MINIKKTCAQAIDTTSITHINKQIVQARSLAHYYNPIFIDTLKKLELKLKKQFKKEDLKTPEELYIYYSKRNYSSHNSNLIMSDHFKDYDSLRSMNLPAKILINIEKAQGVEYDHANEYKKSLECFTTALNIAEKNNLEDEARYCVMHITYTIIYRLNFDSQWISKQKKLLALYGAEHLLEAEDNFVNKLKDPLENILILNNLASIDEYRERNDIIDREFSFVTEKTDLIKQLKSQEESYEKIVKEYNYILDFYENKNHKSYLYYAALFSYADLLFEHKNYEQANELIEIIFKKTKKDTGYDVIDYYRLLDLALKSYKHTGNFERALFFEELKNVYYSKQIFNGELAYEFLFEKKKNEENRLELLTKEKTKRRNLIIISILAGIFGFIIYNYYRRNLNLKSLKQINENLIAEKLKVAETLEKKLQLEIKLHDIQIEIAKDLHDNFGNRLAALHNSTDVLQDIMLKKDFDTLQFNKFIKNLDDVMVGLSIDIKDLIWSNNPKNNKLKSLMQRIEMVFANIANSKNYKVNIEYNKIDYDYELPNFWNRQILLIFKEALNNSIKYSNTSKISLISEIDKEGFLIIIFKDYGAGFDINKVKRKSGILNMQKRAEFIDSSLTIISSKKLGTEIILKSNSQIQEFT